MKGRTIAIEEHYIDSSVNDYYRLRGNALTERLSQLEDMALGRLAEMDAASIDMQVLSHAPPGLQGVDREHAVSLAWGANNRLARIVASNPSRFAALASLPTAQPDAAADELERVVTEHGFKGAIIHGAPGGTLIDDPCFRPIFARAAMLDVPIYLHPADPLPEVARSYFGDYAKTHPNFPRAAWGFTIETATQAIRLVLSGVFDEFPKLQIILGHLGETIPFLMDRIDEALARDSPMKNFSEVFTRHFYITTSGFFSDPALLCCLQTMGADRILFSVDWPYASNSAARTWIDRVALAPDDRRKILSGNAERLLGLSSST